jgi:hypothetical protein
MKAKIFILCTVLSLGVGCKKAEQADRYKVFSASWEELSGVTVVTQKNLVKVDSVTGRVWFWHREISGAKEFSGWIEMTDSGLVLPPSLQSQKN